MTRRTTFGLVNAFHVRLLVDDFAACFRFYRDALGLRPTWGEESSGYASFEVPGGSLSMHDRNDFASGVGTELRAPGDSAALIFGVEDLDAVVERLHGLGVPFLAEPTAHPDWGIRTAHLRDPHGNVIELNEPIPQEEWTAELREESERYES